MRTVTYLVSGLFHESFKKGFVSIEVALPGARILLKPLLLGKLGKEPDPVPLICLQLFQWPA